MFKCGRCQKVSEPRVKPKRVVLETRERVYRQTVYDEKARMERTYEAGSGREIAREISLGPCCSSE